MTNLRVPLIAFDKFKGTVKSVELNQAVFQEMRRSFGRHYPILRQSLTDGGDGFLDQLTESWGSGNLIQVPDLLLSYKGKDDTTGSASLPTRRFRIGLGSSRQLPERFRDNNGLSEKEFVGVLERASICGFGLLSETDRHPASTSTANIAHGIQMLQKLGAKKIILGIGGSATNDMGAGCLQQLGVKFLDQNKNDIPDIRPARFHEVESIDVSELEETPEILISCDVDNPLLGPDGCTRIFAPQKGLRDDQVEEAESQIARLASLLAAATGKPMSCANKPGMGAAGGIGYGLTMTLKAELVNGFQIFSDWVDLPEKIMDSSWVITGEGSFDRTSLNGKAPAEILRMAAMEHRKLALICARIDQDAVSELEEEIGQKIHTFELSPDGKILKDEELSDQLLRATRDVISMINSENDSRI